MTDRLHKNLFAVEIIGHPELATETFQEVQFDWVAKTFRFNMKEYEDLRVTNWLKSLDGFFRANVTVTLGDTSVVPFCSIRGKVTELDGKVGLDENDSGSTIGYGVSGTMEILA
jgi:hypothetical protein